MTTVQDYANAVLARSWREESATQLFAEELRNFRTNAHGDGEAPIQLRDWMRSASRDSLANQRDAYETQLKEERRMVPDHIMGSEMLNMAREITDAGARLTYLTGLVEDAEALAKAARFQRRDVIAGMVADGMTFAQIGALMGITREAAWQISKKEG